jgi:hypothetical protein
VVPAVVAVKSVLKNEAPESEARTAFEILCMQNIAFTDRDRSWICKFAVELKPFEKR